MPARQRLQLVASVLAKAGRALEQVAGLTLVQGRKHRLRLSHYRFQQRAGTGTKFLDQRLDLPLAMTSITPSPLADTAIEFECDRYAPDLCSRKRRFGPVSILCGATNMVNKVSHEHKFRHGDRERNQVRLQLIVTAFRSLLSIFRQTL